MKQNIYVFSSNVWIIFKKMHILFYKFTSNSSKKMYIPNDDTQNYPLYY